MNFKLSIPRIQLDTEWPVEFQDAHVYDRLEVWGERFNSPYATAYAVRRERTLAALKDFCPPPAKILDLAGASGNFSISAAQIGYTVTWNDLRSDMEEYVRMKLPKDVNLEFLGGNILDLSDEMIGRFDVVFALEVIEHVARPDAFLRRLAEFVKPGGLIIASTPNGAYFRNKLPKFSTCEDPSVFESIQFKPNSDGHIFLLYEDEMREFGEKAELTLIRYEQFCNPLTAGHIRLRHLHSVFPMRWIERIEMYTRGLPKPVVSAIHCASLAVYRK